MDKLKLTVGNKGSYAIAGAVGSFVASRRLLIGLADRKRITFEAATAHSLKRLVFQGRMFRGFFTVECFW